jgi:pimeloyl-ACP methyl ester carboxylesterase
MTMTTISPAATSRFNFAYSGNGHYGVCLRAVNDELTLERWTLLAEEAACQELLDVAVSRQTHALPLDDGGVLLLQPDGLPRSGVPSLSRRYEVVLLRPSGSCCAPQRLGEIPALGGYLVPSPSSAQLGFAVMLDDSEQSTIWRVPASAAPIESVVRVPGALSGYGWLDTESAVLAVNQASSSHRSSGIAIDLLQGSWRRIWSVSDTSTDRIMLVSPRSKLLVVSTNAAGDERLGWGILGEKNVSFPQTLYRAGYVRQALALDDSGEQVLVHEAAGAVSQLFRYTPATDRLEPLASPAGTISAASWAGDLIRCRFSAPPQPPTLGTLRLGTEPRWSVRRDHQVGSQPALATAELVQLHGPAGPIEAIVYGGPDWRTSRYLVVALHGGPLASWRFEYDPLFQNLVREGIAVVAPNYRGSTGYGDEHLRAVVDRWGGPDLDDVLHLGQSLAVERECLQLPRPVVLGNSYGAFLAVLAAGTQPELWSGCVALAPFLSGPRLYESVSVVVRNRVEKLGGLTPINDTIGPRDLLSMCGSLSAPLLLVHGSSDQTIPVEQSRMLRRRLLELGRIEDIDFEYVEADYDHAGVALAWPEVLRQRIVRFCLARLGTSTCRCSNRPSVSTAHASTSGC